MRSNELKWGNNFDDRHARSAKIGDVFMRTFVNIALGLLVTAATILTCCCFSCHCCNHGRPRCNRLAVAVAANAPMFDTFCEFIALWS